MNGGTMLKFLSRLGLCGIFVVISDRLSVHIRYHVLCACVYVLVCVSIIPHTHTHLRVYNHRPLLYGEYKSKGIPQGNIFSVVDFIFICVHLCFAVHLYLCVYRERMNGTYRCRYIHTYIYIYTHRYICIYIIRAIVK